MSVAAVTKFIVLVDSFFPRPKFSGKEENEALWLRSMADILGKYADDVLVEAADRIVKTRDPDKHGTMFPKPVECIAACEDVLKLRKGAMLQLEGPKGNEWTDDRLTLAFDLANGPLGRRAAREGWIGPLLRFCRRNMRLPKDGEIVEVISVAQEFQEARQRCVDGEAGVLSRPLLALADSIAARSKEHAKRVLGDVV